MSLGRDHALPAVVAAKLHRLIDLGVGERLVLALVPAEARKDAQIRRQLLLRIQAEAVLHRAILFVQRNLRRLVRPVQIRLHRIAIEPHVRMVHKAQHADHSLAVRADQAAEQ